MTLSYTHLKRLYPSQRENQYILVAQCVWWLSSIIGLQQGLVIYIDNLKSRIEISQQVPVATVTEEPAIHPDRVLSIQNTTKNTSDSETE